MVNSEFLTQRAQLAFAQVVSPVLHFSLRPDQTTTVRPRLAVQCTVILDSAMAIVWWTTDWRYHRFLTELITRLPQHSVTAPAVPMYCSISFHLCRPTAGCQRPTEKKCSAAGPIDKQNNKENTIRYDTIEEFNVDSKALSSTRSQKKKLKQTTPVPR